MSVRGLLIGADVTLGAIVLLIVAVLILAGHRERPPAVRQPTAADTARVDSLTAGPWAIARERP